MRGEDGSSFLKHARNFIRKVATIHNHSLKIIPNEVWSNIFSYLKKQDIPRVGTSCKHFNDLLKNSFFRKEFFKTQHCIEEQKYKEEKAELGVYYVAKQCNRNNIVQARSPKNLSDLINCVFFKDKKDAVGYVVNFTQGWSDHCVLLRVKVMDEHFISIIEKNLSDECFRTKFPGKVFYLGSEYLYQNQFSLKGIQVKLLRELNASIEFIAKHITLADVERNITAISPKERKCLGSLYVEIIQLINRLKMTNSLIESEKVRCVMQKLFSTSSQLQLLKQNNSNSQDNIWPKSFSPTILDEKIGELSSLAYENSVRSRQSYNNSSLGS